MFIHMQCPLLFWLSFTIYYIYVFLQFICTAFVCSYDHRQRYYPISRSYVLGISYLTTLEGLISFLSLPSLLLSFQDLHYRQYAFSRNFAHRRGVCIWPSCIVYSEHLIRFYIDTPQFFQALIPPPQRIIGTPREFTEIAIS